MKRLQLWVRAFFGFSRLETNGFLLLIPLVFVLLFSEPVYRAWVGPPPIPDIDKTDSLLAWMEMQNSLLLARKTDTIVFRHFDPNLVTEKELQGLGLGERVASRWVRYREKGGRFRTIADVGKIYGMDTAWFGRARRWIRITAENRITGRYQKKKTVILEDINSADSLSLMDVYGIGPALARRIVLFRSRLGGFVSMNQLTEVYGLDSAVVLRMRRQFEVRPGFEPIKIDLKRITFEELAGHPYISRRQAQAIASYRSQHGISSAQELMNIKVLDSLWYVRILPYLKLAP
jgi:DNA uptake protein ComE-like DNA-binding protein